MYMYTNMHTKNLNDLGKTRPLKAGASIPYFRRVHRNSKDKEWVALFCSQC